MAMTTYSRQRPAFKRLMDIDYQEKELLAKILVALVSSPAFTAITAAGIAVAQWNLEHVALYSYVRGGKRRWALTRLSTQDTSILTDKRKTPLSPPIVSMATRLADKGADTAEAAFSLAQAQIETNRERGLIGNLLTFLFGSSSGTKTTSGPGLEFKGRG